ncbi:hypothetical protein TVAG_206320 [Trichomonas vaginalis G3]|uniref:Mediator of RNA polymerase II transcription subunit 11 n=1 Tax=Trichomonas vaginalis (strain ATCC PRA-98 / G3) TaxID=412133 RepID=A2E1L7_TRIV3|nr:hypothetical protein TVAGG3_0519130 [Trichomonas vaginalis G3]EAY13464.1 hypothetical protein TVAG_206320 [Trichomonas vaginalis G3]KAI5518341.1 hypothetical protein TVAGG3_0519130 [Trichomonas vaginalis G3]|eukprot:XP_001325687.1 hypothetical protein [Trichomonas vaginalis G3]
MSGRLAKLEEAEDLVIAVLNYAAQAIKELKEIQANTTEKKEEFFRNSYKYYIELQKVQEILKSELDTISNAQTPSRRPGVDQLAIASWEAKVIAENLHDLLE